MKQSDVLPNLPNKMTLKQRKFVRALIRTQSPTEAAMQSYNCKDRVVATVIASQNLIKLNIQMVDLMNRMGLDTERDIKDLTRLREAKTTKHFAHEGKIVDQADIDDNNTQLKALELSLKLKGSLKDEGIKIDKALVQIFRPEEHDPKNVNIVKINDKRIRSEIRENVEA